MQGVKRMEKLLLRLFFSGKKLNIIYKQNVNAAVFVAEIFRLVITDAVNEFVREFL